MAFEGVRVLDLSSTLSGAYAARLFADFGADVVLVEEPGVGHALRAEPPFVGGIAGYERSILHGTVNWNKRSVTCDSPDILRSLAASADVLITTDVQPWGMLLEDLVAAECKSAVHLSLTPHGIDGPLAGLQGNGLTASAQAGWCKINGVHGQVPLQLPVRLPGYFAGIAGFVGAAAALFRGTGEFVDMSEVEVLATANAPWGKMSEFDGLPGLGYRGNCQWGGSRRIGKAGPLLWPTSDGDMHFAIGDWVMWDQAFQFLGAEDLVNSKYSSTWGRYSLDLRPVNKSLAAVAVERSKWELFHGLSKLHCVSGVVQNAADLLNSEQLKSRGFLVSTSIAGTDVIAPGPIAQMSSAPWKLKREAPVLGSSGAQAVAAEWVAGANASSATQASQQTEALPLQGVRVLTFTQAWSGTWATTLLALLGADVVQIESRYRPDVWRGAGRGVPETVRGQGQVKEQNPLNCCAMYNSANFNKRAITLDLKSERGRELFWSMVPKFDVVVDNFAPHVMESWGITLATLHAANPRIIFASVSAYGSWGPFAAYPGNGNTTEPMAGFSAMNGYSSGEPCNTGGLIPDPLSGYYLCASILVALHCRIRTGKGQRIDASMMEFVASTAPADAISEYSANGNVRKPSGNRHPLFAPHAIYASKDQDVWIALATETDAAWASLAARVGIQDVRFGNKEGRKLHEEELDMLLGRWCQQKDADEEVAALQALGVIAARVADFLPLHIEPTVQWRHRGFLQQVTHPESGTHWMATVPWKLARTTCQPVHHSPCFGEHCREVLREEAGISDEEYMKLENAGITGTGFLGLRPRSKDTHSKL